MGNDIPHKIIGAAIEVHKVLGDPGLLKGIYLIHKKAKYNFFISLKLEFKSKAFSLKKATNFKGVIRRTEY